MRPTRLAFASILLLAALPLAWLVAGVPKHVATEIAIGTAPMDVASPDDRIVAALLGTSAVTISWIDTATFDEGPYTVGLDGEQAHAVEGATLDGQPVVFVGGSQVDVLRFDLSTTPAASPGVDAAIGLGDDPGPLVALEWDAARSTLFAGDDQGLLRRVQILDGGGVVDSGSSWPLDLAFVPSDLVLLNGSTLLVSGDDGGWPVLALVDLSDDENPVTSEVDPDLADGLPVAVTADGAGRAWVLHDSGEIWLLATDEPGDDDDSADDDDDSAGDDDDSGPGDDDDSAAGDDDDSAAGDDDDSAAVRDAPRDDWLYSLFATGPSSGADLAWLLVDGADTLYATGGNLVHVVDEVGTVSADFSLSGAASALVASDDGYVYVTEETDQLAVLSDGPWVTIDSASPTSIGDLTDELVIDFTVTLSDTEAGSCTWTLAVDADIAGGGTALTPTGTAGPGEAVQTSVTGADLPGGDHRVWIFCAEADGAVGRASFAYTSTALAAPTGFSVTPDDGKVTASWTDDASASSWVLYFDEDDFEETDTPTLCNSDSSICSPHQVLRDGDDGDDDDTAEDEARDDDDSAGDDDDDTSTDDDDTDSDSDSISVEVTGLTNGTTYWFALAARTADGEDGPRTATVSATPSRTGGAAVLAGDVGGCSCNNSLASRRIASILALLPLLLLLRRRR